MGGGLGVYLDWSVSGGWQVEGQIPRYLLLRRIIHRRIWDYFCSTDLLVVRVGQPASAGRGDFSVGLDSSGTRAVSRCVMWQEWRARRRGYVVETSWTATGRTRFLGLG
jgi:hypothetical protein